MIKGPDIFVAVREAVASHVNLLHPNNEIRIHHPDDFFMGDEYDIECKRGRIAHFRLIMISYGLDDSVLDTHHLVLAILENFLPIWTAIAWIRSHVEDDQKTLRPVMNSICKNCRKECLLERDSVD